MIDLKDGSTDSIVFPENGMVESEIYDAIEKHIKDVANWEDTSRLGFAMTEPSKISLDIIKKYIHLNSNNIGIHTRFGEGLNGTRYLEKQALGMLAGLYNGRALDGYITSGGTEGNICGLRIGRNILKRENNQSPTVICSELTHHSIEKACEILDIKLEKLPISLNYIMDLEQLESTIVRMLGEGNKNFIIVSTAGYYSVGTIDNIKGISELIEKLQFKYKDIRIYHHLDAAYGGFIIPFSNPKVEFDFRNLKLHSMTVDPHKIGLMPYGCGVFLCRKGLIDTGQIKAEKSGVIDETIIGSRAGVYAASLYANLLSFGKDGYKNIINTCLDNTNYFINEIKKIDEDIIIIRRADMNVFAISFSKMKKLTRELETKYRLVANKMPIYCDLGKVEKISTFYHIYIMPNIVKAKIDDFILELKKLINKSPMNASIEHITDTEIIKEIKSSTPCPRHSVVHPLGQRDPKNYPDNYSFHSFVSRNSTMEKFESQLLYYSEEVEQDLYFYAPDLKKPFGNELGGIAVKGKYNFEILDEFQSDLSLIGDSHFFLHSKERSSQALINFYKNGKFRSLELKVGNTNFTDELQLFENKIIFKIAKDARAIYRGHEDYSFSIDTAAEIRIKINNSIEEPIIKDVQYNSDPFLTRKKHLNNDQFKRFPNRFFGFIVELEIPYNGLGEWSLRELLKSHGWESILYEHSALLGICSIDLHIKSGQVTLYLKSLNTTDDLTITIPKELLGKLAMLPKFDVTSKNDIDLMKAAKYSERLYSIFSPILEHISESHMDLNNFNLLYNENR